MEWFSSLLHRVKSVRRPSHGACTPWLGQSPRNFLEEVSEVERERRGGSPRPLEALANSEDSKQMTAERSGRTKSVAALSATASAITALVERLSSLVRFAMTSNVLTELVTP